MNLLLDTHALIWFLEDGPLLSNAARAAISHADNRCFVSDATAWEMAIKYSLGKLKLPVPYGSLFPQRLQSEGFSTLPLRQSHLHRLIDLEWHHRDPFDRLLIAQAMVENLTIVTRDAEFAEYNVSLLW